jgi:large subunit ribosomal protein L10Ae
MTKLTNAQINQAIELALAERKTRGFPETIDLQIMLRDFNTDKEKKFNSTVLLNHPVRRQMKICVVGNIGHVDQAKALGIDTQTLDEVNIFAKDAKLVKKWARKYDMILVSDALKLKFIKLVGKQVNSVGQQPSFVLENENIESKLKELLQTVRFRIKKGPWLATAIACDSLSVDEIRQNVLRAVNFLVSLLPKGWQNIRSLNIKSTMGAPSKLL